MPFSGPIEDRVAIHELVASYGDAVTRRDERDWIACWAQDAVWKLDAIPGMTDVHGKDEILRTWLSAMPGWPLQVNFQRCGAIEVNGDAATGRTYTDELCVDASGKAERWLNRYDDAWIKCDGQWLFNSRSLTILKIGPA